MEIRSYLEFDRNTTLFRDQLMTICQLWHPATATGCAYCEIFYIPIILTYSFSVFTVYNRCLLWTLQQYAATLYLSVQNIETELNTISCKCTLSKSLCANQTCDIHNINPVAQNQVSHLHECFLKWGYCIKWVRLLSRRNWMSHRNWVETCTDMMNQQTTHHRSHSWYVFARWSPQRRSLEQQ